MQRVRLHWAFQQLQDITSKSTTSVTCHRHHLRQQRRRNPQAVQRTWDEEPMIMSEETMKSIALGVVREKMLNHIHQEIPYAIEHRLMDSKKLRNGSLRIEEHFITPKPSQCQILVGKNGSKIGRIGIEANEELRSIFKRVVHLILQVRVARRKGA